LEQLRVSGTPQFHSALFARSAEFAGRDWMSAKHETTYLGWPTIL
jgi:hypothetical protein